MAKHKDPMIGETLYQLSNIKREAPPAQLFSVPSNYQIKEGPALPPAPQ